MDKLHFNRFDEIKHKPLQAFNRTVQFNNYYYDKGRDMAEQYANIFSDRDRKEMYLIQLAVKNMGVDAVRKAVTKDLVVTYDPANDLGSKNVNTGY